MGGGGGRETWIGKNVIFPKYYEQDCLKNEKKIEKELPIDMCQIFLKNRFINVIDQLKKVSPCGLIPKRHVQWQPFLNKLNFNLVHFT